MNIRAMATRYAAVDWSSPKIKAVDYGVSALTVAYCLYGGSPVVVGVGLLGGAATFWGLNACIVRAVQGAVSRRRARG